MKLIAIVFGVLLVLFGALWLLQGLGIVTMAPILCVAQCEAVTGPSILWSIIGGLSIAIGGALIARGRGRRPRA